MSSLQNGSQEMCCIEGEFVLCSQETRKLQFSSKLIKIKFDWGDLKILTIDIRKSKKDYRTGDVYVDSSTTGTALRLDEM